MAETQRLYYLDNLKVFLIMLVILHHVGQAYGTTGGGWPYAYPGDRSKPLGLMFCFNASFFMGLFFFISGYFLPRSYDRHGARKFLTDKLIRFGVPLAFAALAMMPAIEYVKYLHYTNDIAFAEFYARHWFGYAPDAAAPGRAFNFGHLWFIEHLLVYSILYAAVGSVLRTGAVSAAVPAPRKAPLYAIIPYIVLLGAVTHLMRTSWGFPTDRWIFLLGFIQMEPAHLPQYLSLFVIGILAYRWSFLESLAAPRNMVWLLFGVGIYGVTLAQMFITDRGQAFHRWEYREALLCVGVCIGLLALFNAYFNRTGRLGQILAENAFGAYIVHVPVVVALQYAFDPVRAGAFTLFVVVSALAIPGAFLASILLRLIPGVRRVL